MYEVNSNSSDDDPTSRTLKMKKFLRRKKEISKKKINITRKRKSHQHECDKLEILGRVAIP